SEDARGMARPAPGADAGAHPPARRQPAGARRAGAAQRPRHRRGADRAPRPSGRPCRCGTAGGRDRPGVDRGPEGAPATVMRLTKRRYPSDACLAPAVRCSPVPPWRGCMSSTTDTRAMTLGPRGFGQTTRRDAWWASPLATFVVLSAFVVYATWAAFQNAHYTFGPYLSPFYSPEIFGDPAHAWFGGKPGWWPLGLPFSPALIILPFPGLFRLTCYYYRGAYY